MLFNNNETENKDFLKLLEHHNDAPTEKYLPKTVFCTDNQTHF